jgi:hypothetical protein
MSMAQSLKWIMPIRGISSGIQSEIKEKRDAIIVLMTITTNSAYTVQSNREKKREIRIEQGRLTLAVIQPRD